MENLILTEDDVPGAKLPHSKISQNIVANLKRWLICRNISATGLKQDLILRVEECIASGNASEIFVGIDKGRWLQEKQQKILGNKNTTLIVVSPTLPEVGWSTFPSCPIPRSFCYEKLRTYITQVNERVAAHLYNSGVDQDANEPNCGNSKCLQRGRISFASGHVKQMQDCARGTDILIRAMVDPSFKNTAPYKVHITLNNEGNVIDASCKCPARESKNCSHVIALLFALEDYTLQFGYEPLTGTSKLKTWNQGRKKGNHPQAVVEANYPKEGQSHLEKKENSRKRFLNFTPKMPITPKYNKKQKQTDFIRDIQTLSRISMFEYLTSIHYEDYELDDERHALLALQVEIVLNNLGQEEGVLYCIPVLRSSIERYNQTCLRILATKTKKFFTVKQTDELIAEKLWRPFNSVEISPLRDERKEEAIDEYVKMKDVTVTLIEKSEILVNGGIPPLCCAPDGVIRGNDGNFLYFIKVQCSSQYYHEGEDSYVIDEKDNTVHMKHSHDYYFEIMATMAVLDVDFCDFLVWTGPGFLRVERIYRDELLIYSIRSKLSNVQKNLIVEYLEMREPRNLKLFNIY